MNRDGMSAHLPTEIGGYAYMDFVRIGLPLNLITWAVGLVAILAVFPL